MRSAGKFKLKKTFTHFTHDGAKKMMVEFINNRPDLHRIPSSTVVNNSKGRCEIIAKFEVKSK